MREDLQKRLNYIQREEAELRKSFDMAKQMAPQLLNVRKQFFHDIVNATKPAEKIFRELVDKQLFPRNFYHITAATDFCYVTFDKEVLEKDIAESMPRIMITEDANSHISTLVRSTEYFNRFIIRHNITKENYSDFIQEFSDKILSDVLSYAQYLINRKRDDTKWSVAASEKVFKRLIEGGYEPTKEDIYEMKSLVDKEDDNYIDLE